MCGGRGSVAQDRPKGADAYRWTVGIVLRLANAGGEEPVASGCTSSASGCVSRATRNTGILNIDYCMHFPWHG